MSLKSMLYSPYVVSICSSSSSISNISSLNPLAEWDFLNLSIADTALLILSAMDLAVSLKENHELSRRFIKLIAINLRVPISRPVSEIPFPAFLPYLDSYFGNLLGNMNFDGE